MAGDVTRRLEEHLLALDRAWSGHDHDLVIADLHAAHVDDRVRGPELATRELEWFGDRDDLVNAAEVREGFAIGVGVGADDTDERPLLAPRQLCLQADLVDAVHDGGHLGLGRRVGHDDYQRGS